MKELVDNSNKINKEITSLQSSITSISENHELLVSNLSKVTSSLNSVSKRVKKLEVDQFCSILKSKLEYVIQRNGKVSEEYWGSITNEYDIYHNTLHRNSYMTKLYEEASNLIIDSINGRND